MIVDMGCSNNLELMGIVKQYAEQRGVDSNTVISAIEEAIAVFEANKYKYNKIVVNINHNTGRILAFKQLLVVEDGKSSGVFIDGYQCIEISRALKIDPDTKIGNIVQEVLPPISLSESARNAFFSKSVLRAKLAEIIRDKNYDIFKDLVGEIVTGIVKRVDNKTLTVDAHGTETMMPISNLIRGELFRKGDRIKAYLSSVTKDSDGVYLNLSRTHPQFVVQLFKQEVPEIYDGIVKIHSIARAPGSRTKISVISSDSNIDPVGACVGMRGVRVKAIVDELKGEKIDIVEYSSDPATFVVSALSSVEVVKVILDEEAGSMEVVVPDKQLSMAIGKKGQNIGLISVLVGWKIDVLSEKDESMRRASEMQVGTELFMKALDVEKMMAQLLVAEGYLSINSIVNASVYDLSSIEGFDKDIAEELINRAKNYLLENEDRLFRENIDENNNNKLFSLPEITPIMLLCFSDNNIDTIEDLANLSREELKEVLTKNDTSFIEANKITDEYLDRLIILAREKSGWFK